MLRLFACKLLIIAGALKTIAGKNRATDTWNIHSTVGRRIIAGYPSVIAWVPYYIYVSLRDDNVRRTCGGSIISSRWVVTAAHCMYRERKRIPDDRIHLYAGTSNSDILENSAQMKHVILSIIHSDWINPHSDRISDNDIALLKTCTPLKYTNVVQPIRLAPTNYVLPNGVRALACGFGDTGDSGGPLMYLDGTNPVLIGVASGTGCKINVGGGSFTNVSLYRDWIRRITAI